MKIFVYKTIIVIFSFFLLFQFTIGRKLNDYENKIESIYKSDREREKIFEKIKDEIKTANEKDNIFTIEERELISTFIDKVKKELSIDGEK